MAYSFPEEVLEHVFSFIHTDKDRNAISLVCKSWYEVERWSRRRIFIGNCYAVSPGIVIRRFPELRSVALKGKPHFADFNLVPDGWGGNVYPWIAAMAMAYPMLEELRLKRMVVTDESLELISRSFKNFKVLVLSSCEGFSTDGLAAIAANCSGRFSEESRISSFDLLSFATFFLSNQTKRYNRFELKPACEVDIGSPISLIPDFAHHWCPSTFPAWPPRCPSLRTLRLNRAVPLDRLPNLLRRAPQLVELGTGAYSAEHRPEVFSSLAGAFSNCKELKSLSGFWDVVPDYLPAVYPACSGITSLNLSYATIQSPDLIKLVTQCQNLQRLWVLDYIEDSGLDALAASCKDLQELRVFPSEPYDMEGNVALTEQGLVSVSEGCPKLHSVLYFCRQMTNAALVSIAKNRPNMTRFRLCIIEPRTRDYQTLEPLDVGFGAIVEHCKELHRLSLSGLLTDRVFEYIGTHAKKLEMLSVAFAGDGDLGLHHVLSGCKSLRKLEIRDCPFGDKALLANAAKLETMRSLWMSSCSVSFGACKLLGQKMPRLNVEVMDERGRPDSRPESCSVEKLYIYRSVAGPRSDMPRFVWTMKTPS
uniref:F-box domain-containing protein n=1 Tax=Vitis vinifera TaxID=29760 RepID=A5AML2_VITVI|nr:hypothetical protein VITISV_036655 [Vitis vinifera]